MDNDRINGAIDKAKGTVKEAAGKVTGDPKLEAEGKLDKASGAIKGVVGGVKDAIRDATDKNPNT